MIVPRCEPGALPIASPLVRSLDFGNAITELGHGVLCVLLSQNPALRKRAAAIIDGLLWWPIAARRGSVGGGER